MHADPTWGHQLDDTKFLHQLGDTQWKSLCVIKFVWAPKRASAGLRPERELHFP